METEKSYSKKQLWAGRIIKGLCIAFLLVDAVMKIIMAKPSVDGSVMLGFPLDSIQGIGISLLIFTLLYSVPRVAIIGAVLLTAYLGGAVAITVRAHSPGHPYLFPVFFNILIWAGLYLHNEKLRILFNTKQYVVSSLY